VFVYFTPDYDVYVVRSESMTPAINMADVIFTGPIGGPDLPPVAMLSHSHG